MEKQAAKSKSKILSFLPKASQLAAVSFQNPSFSPGRDKRPDIASHKLRTHNNRKTFSGPIVSMIPSEARRRSKNSETTQDPISPIVSCMGQIKHKNRIISKIRPEYPVSDSGPKKKPSGIKNFFGSGRKADNKASVTERAPCLSKMTRFASGRESKLANFDWATARIVPEDKDNGFCSAGYSDDIDDVIIIPVSAPIIGAGTRDGGGLRMEPRKEINLWKRRTMAQPEPLQLSWLDHKKILMK
ncbi:hypothetical protein CASFOL_016006 [Castilleja foliolosa]|uniref:Syringolide-induced protein 14-1-1 n=1 Tax=Castilleja foliolosa TaxID=1961234 RepID=A0ABD3DFC7_9LAMI